MNNIQGVAMGYIQGLLFGAGFLTAVVIFKVVLHIGLCG